MYYRFLLSLALFVFAGLAFADGPRDNNPDDVRPVPAAGIQLSDEDRKELQAGVEELGKKIEALRTQLKNKPALLELLPDVQIYHKAVQWGVQYQEIFRKEEIPGAKAMLKRGMERAQQLEQGKAPWETATGPVARGYISKIDGSVQPYGIFVPASYRPGSATAHRLDAWFHGRGENLSELNFIAGVQGSGGPFQPPNAFVLQPYGRYCCANKLAGEVDLFEALAHVRKHYPIDEDRIVVRGFSMGGAACWQFAVHHAGRWAAAAPGAGFSETADFLKNFQQEKLQPTWYEEKLWHMYDCTDYALNLYNCPTVAYSGEKDNQKQAADMMEKALAKEGIDLVHLIGPGMGHGYHPDSKKEIDRRIDSIVAKGRNRVPERVRFTTWTLRYNQMLWVKVDRLTSHWARARVDAEILRPIFVKVATDNVAALTLEMPSGYCPLETTRRPLVSIDGQDLIAAPSVKSDRSWTAHFRKDGDKWTVVESTDDGKLHKRHGLQGPIDDAFLNRFVMVKPTGKPLNEKVGAWTASELEHARVEWRRQFRGDAPVKNDDAITDADIANSNLVLWGDPSSNKVLAKIADKLPIKWTSDAIQVGNKTYAVAHHMPLLIYPNPLNPKRYVVLNSGFTYREFAYLNNARQVPKLPDYAVVDVNTPSSSLWPGKVVDAGFFDEEWKLAQPSR